MLLGVARRSPTASPISSSLVPRYSGIRCHVRRQGHANALISLSECVGDALYPADSFFLKRFGIKRVVLPLAMFAWVLRFGLFGLGNPGGGDMGCSCFR